jgi:hypothetical protein
MVQEAKNFKTLRLQRKRALLIRTSVDCMLPTIYLTDNHLFRAEKVSYKGSHWMLHAKFKATESPVSKMMPKQALGIGHGLAQGPGALSAYYLTPHPNPLPYEGRGDSILLYYFS